MLKELYDNQDLAYRSFILKLVVTKYKVIGVRIPILRKIAKQNKNNITFFINKNSTFEEIMLQGMMIGYSSLDILKKINLIKKFLPYIDNWSICDSVCATIKPKEKEEFYTFLLSLKNSREEYYLRFMLVMFNFYYKDKEYLLPNLDIIAGINSEQYYVAMAQSWVVSTYYFIDKEMVLTYLKNKRFTTFVHNKSIAKIKESLKCLQAEKLYLDCLRIVAK